LTEITPESNSAVNGDDRYRAMRRVTLVGALVNAVLAAGKILLGFVAQSQALIADGVHSLADLFSDAVVLVAAKHSSREADDEHPYGHGRIETVVSVALGLLLIGVAAAILIDAVSRILEPERLLAPSWIALAAAFISILANEWLYHYTRAVAQRLNSRLLLANAWHHRSDAISSVIALIGIGGSLAGFPMLDAVAAIGVSLMIAKVGWDIAWSSLQELVDRALDEKRVERIRDTIMAVDGVKEVHALRTRSMGGQALVDVHILIDNPRISVSEGHQISEAVQHSLLHKIDEVNDVVVHIDPEDDEQMAPNRYLPLRKKIMAQLNQAWGREFYAQSIQQVVLHYLNGKISVEVVLPLALVSQADLVRHSLQSIAKEQQHIKQIIASYRDAQ